MALILPIFPGLPTWVRVVEVGPRDGLQNEHAQVPTQQKVQFIQMLAEAGLSVVEATSFVSPRSIPQLSDASEVMMSLLRQPTTDYPVLVPNLKGMERALAAGVHSIAVFTAASESFTRHNINATIAESLANFRPVIELARRENISVRGYISTVFGCPYEGSVAPRQVFSVAQSLLEMGVENSHWAIRLALQRLTRLSMYLDCCSLKASLLSASPCIFMIHAALHSPMS